MGLLAVTAGECGYLRLVSSQSAKVSRRCDQNTSICASSKRSTSENLIFPSKIAAGITYSPHCARQAVAFFKISFIRFMELVSSFVTLHSTATTYVSPKATGDIDFLIFFLPALESCLVPKLALIECPALSDQSALLPLPTPQFQQ